MQFSDPAPPVDEVDAIISLDGPKTRVPDGVRFLAQGSQGREPASPYIEDEDPPEVTAAMRYINGHFVLADTMSGPHEFVPLRWRDRFKRGDGGNCRHCYWPRSTHAQIEGQWVPARPLGDLRSARQVYRDAEFDRLKRDPRREP